MSLRQAVRNLVMSSPAVVGYVEDRCYQDRLPDAVSLPAVVIKARVSEIDEEYRSHDTTPVGRAVARSQLDVYAGTGDEAEHIALAIIAVVSSANTDTINGAQIENVLDTWEAGLNRFRTIIDVMVDYRRF